MVLYIKDIADIMAKIASRLEAKGLKLKPYSTAFTPDGETILARFSDEALLDKVWHTDTWTNAEKTDVAQFTIFTANIPARFRMTTLYGVAAILGDSRVVNTCNRSEDYVGYSTKFGDSAGDFSPLSNLTVREVKILGYQLGIPMEFIEKIPEDGLSGKTDEDNLGFSYSTLDDYLLHGIKPNPEILENIERRHRNNLHKLEPMPSYDPEE